MDLAKKDLKLKKLKANLKIKNKFLKFNKNKIDKLKEDNILLKKINKEYKLISEEKNGINDALHKLIKYIDKMNKTLELNETLIKQSDYNKNLLISKVKELDM